MKKLCIKNFDQNEGVEARTLLVKPGKTVAVAGIGLVLFLVLTGCKTTPQYTDWPETSTGTNEIRASDLPRAITGTNDTPAQADAIILREGDSVRITFPGAPNLNTVQSIRRDGRIALPMGEEFKAVGMTAKEMEKELLKLYEPQLQTKEVIVSVESSAFFVYLVGAVFRPGKILSDRPITALEAILEAGGFDPAKANLKAVRVIRHDNGRTRHYLVNLKGVLKGADRQQFQLRPGDIVYVPERFSWF